MRNSEIGERITKPEGKATLENLETHPKNPMIARVFRELGWVEELGSGRKNIRKYAPFYYPDYRIEIENEEKFVFSITYRNEDENVNDKERPFKRPLNDKERPLKRPLNEYYYLQVQIFIKKKLPRLLFQDSLFPVFSDFDISMPSRKSDNK